MAHTPLFECISEALPNHTLALEVLDVGWFENMHGSLELLIVYIMIYIYTVYKIYDIYDIYLGLLGFVFHPSFEVIDHVHVDPFWCPWSLLKKMPGWVSRDFARRCRGLLRFGTYPLRDPTTTAIHHVHRMRWRGIWHCHWCPRSRLWLDCWRPQRNRGSLFLHKKNHSEPTDVNVMNVW